MPESHLGELAGPEVFHEGVALGHKAQDDVDRLLVFQVEGDAALVAGVERPPRRDAVDLLAPLPHRVAGRRLDFYDLGTQIGEQPRAERRGDEMANLENAQARQRAVWGSFEHVLIPARPLLYDGWVLHPADGCEPSRSTWTQNQRAFANLISNSQT